MKLWYSRHRLVINIFCYIIIVCKSNYTKSIGYLLMYRDRKAQFTHFLFGQKQMISKVTIEATLFSLPELVYLCYTLWPTRGTVNSIGTCRLTLTDNDTLQFDYLIVP